MDWSVKEGPLAVRQLEMRERGDDERGRRWWMCQASHRVG